MWRLSKGGQEGLEYARSLAEDWPAWRAARMHHQRFTLDDRIAAVAERYSGVTPATIRFRIYQARTDLFGKVTDQAIYQALKRDKEIRNRAPEKCHAVGCTNLLPRNRRRTRKYCSETCRVRAFRHGQEDVPVDGSEPPAAPAEPPAPLTERDRWLLEQAELRIAAGYPANEAAKSVGIRPADLEALFGKASGRLEP